ncbi:hypothetical protein TNCV_2989961 [Trichonephila clavipes]|nr:hypothetical protein TNCV_2989961 [Trichonephila clavipes]
MIVVSAQIESEFVDENHLIPFGCSTILSITPNGGDGEGFSIALYVMVSVVVNVLQPGFLRWYDRNRGPKSRRYMYLDGGQLDIYACVSYGLLGYWSVEDVLSLVAVLTDISFVHWSHHLLTVKSEGYQ